MSLGVLQDFCEGSPHGVIQLVVDLRFQPKIALTVLYPFKVGHSNAARVRQDVRDNEHPLVGQNVVRVGRRGTVCTLAQDTGLDSVGHSCW